MKKILHLIFSVFLTLPVFAQGILTYNGNNNYTLVERTNLRRYDNGKYSGLMSREVRSFLSQDMNRNGDIYYSGDFYVEQDTVRNKQVMFTGIHEAIPSRFIINELGFVTMEEDHGFPSFRSFPSFPQDEVRIGESWKGESIRAVDPLNNGIITKIPMTVQYSLVREEIYKGEEVFRITAQWATRYGISYWDFGGDKNLKSAQGKHNATILVSKETGAAIFITDQVDETFTYNDGNSVTYKGTILQFVEYPPSVQHEEIIPALERIGAVAKVETKREQDRSSEYLDHGDYEYFEVNTSTWVGSNNARPYKPAVNPPYPESTEISSDITVEETDAGIRLSIHDLRFKPDSSELLPGESERLDKIASVLKMAEGNSFLVEGHTADTGYPVGELKLSKERAFSIAEELSKRGIDASKFICKGYGAERPLEDNSTPEGKAKNRRVEITILERNK
ncbi:MAG: OmpA family protein [Treponema sp.]|nr:OmpA family protein [Treponema sp.]